MANSVVGLMIDTDKVRAVEVHKWRGKHPKVVRAGEIELAPTAFMHGSITEPEAVSAALRELWQQEGFATKRVVIAVDGRQAIVRRTELPVSKPEALRRAAGFDIEELLSYPLSEAIFDVAEIGSVRSHSGIVANDHRDETEWISTLVVAIHESTRQSLLDVATGAGLKPVAVHLASESLTRSVRSTVGDLGPSPAADAGNAEASPAEASPSGDPVTAIVSVGESQTDVVIRDSGGTLFSRTLTVGVGESALNVADELESQLQSLSGYRSRTDDKTESERRASAAQAGVVAVVEGVRRTLAYYASELDNRPLVEVAISGSRAETAGLQPAMAAALVAEVHLSQPSVAWLESLGHWHSYAAALGAVLCESTTGRECRSFSLVPWKEQEKRADSRRLLVGVAAGALLAGFLFNLTLDRSEDIVAREVAANDAESVRLAMVDEIASYDALAQEAAALQVSTEQIDAILKQEIGFSVVLQELASVMPSQTQLVSIQMRRAAAGEQVVGYVDSDPVGIVSFSGLASDMAGVGAFVESLSYTTLTEGFWLNQSTIGPVGLSGQVGAVFSVEGVITGAAQPQLPLFATVLDPQATGEES